MRDCFQQPANVKWPRPFDHSTEQSSSTKPMRMMMIEVSRCRRRPSSLSSTVGKKNYDDVGMSITEHVVRFHRWRWILDKVVSHKHGATLRSSWQSSWYWRVKLFYLRVVSIAKFIVLSTLFFFSSADLFICRFVVASSTTQTTHRIARVFLFLPSSLFPPPKLLSCRLSSSSPPNHVAGWCW